MIKVAWDYSEFAAHYDKRADYSENCLDAVFHKVSSDKSYPVVDLGAGTGKLTLPLLHHGYSVIAVEPNENMRRLELLTHACCVVGACRKYKSPTEYISDGIFWFLF